MNTVVSIEELRVLVLMGGEKGREGGKTGKLQK